MAKPKIEIEHVDKYYRSTGTSSKRFGRRGKMHTAVQALRDANLTVAEGEFVSLIGPSGCGKTTLLKVLDGLVPYDTGSVRVSGRQVAGPGRDRAFVFQHFGLFPWRTVMGNVTLPLEAAGKSRAEREETAWNYIRMPGIFRPELVESNAHILKRLFTEDRVDYVDAHYELDAISIEPKPTGHIPFWYCGSTPASARRAVRYCDGWMPGRTTLATIAKRVEAMDRMAAEAGRSRPTVAVIPPTSIAKTHDEAFDGLNIDGLLRWANERGKWWVKPPSGVFRTAEDIEGSLIAGSPDEVVEEVTKFAAVEVEHLVFDLRLRFDRWFESIELLGDQVLPRLRELGLAD